MTATEARERLYEIAYSLDAYTAPDRRTDMRARLLRVSDRLIVRADEGADVLLTAQGLEPVMAKLEAVIRELEDSV